MRDSDALFWLLVFVAWLVCIGYAGDVGARKHCRLSGIFLGLFFGPLGIVAAAFLDARPQCPNCGGRLNGTRLAPYPVCPHCRFELCEARVAPRSPSKPADANWEDDLETAKQRLTLAGLVKGE